MAVYKCKMCGGDIELEQGATVGVCGYCGTKQTLPCLDDDRRANLYDRANHFRRNNEFDKAAGIYERILNEDPTDAEAYWSLVLCRYGIEYVDDPATHKRVPTVNRAQFTSVFDDDNYKSALQYADTLQRGLYEEEAAVINEIQKGILAISQKEEPFDVFVCYKETDNNGRRTPDSVLANELYHQLTQEGFKVFFSRITLEDKLGTAYEPYIFAALNSAKVMVVLGTRPEHFNAVWVKNEWSRFLALIKNGEKKMLIPAYKDMDPYDLPEEFSHLQAQDMAKLGFMSDLVRGINKILAPSKEQPKETVVVSGANAEVEPLLKRVFIFLEDGDWDSADKYCERVLDIDPENARAYLGKLMVEMKVKKQDDIGKSDVVFENSPNYKKIKRYADESLNKQIDEYLVSVFSIKKNNHYHSLIDAMNTAHSEGEYRKVAENFRLLGDYQDSEHLSAECLEKADELKHRAEEQALKAERQIDAIAKAIKEKNAGKRSVSLAEQLAREKAKLSKVEPLVQVFDSIVGEIQRAKSESHRIAEEIKELRTRRASLGLFAGKEKKQIDTEIEGLEAKKTSAEKVIKYKTEELKGFSTKQEAEASIQQINGRISELEAKIQEAANLGNAKLTYAQAAKIYYSDEIVRTKFKTKYPELVDSLITIELGSYYQSSGNSKEPIEWLIVEQQGSNLLLISRYALDCKKYNEKYGYVTWETCTLRRWLNSTFINNAFNNDEQKMLQSTTVKADKNPSYDTSPGKNTTDKVFLLSIAETNKYFSTDEERKCVPTDYAIAQGAYTSSSYTAGGKANCVWWLRSPGIHSDYAACVQSSGCEGNGGRNADYDRFAVRPALWISLE